MLHNMKLQPEPFEMIKCGQKTYELRLLDTKRQKVSVGDTIEFLNLKNKRDKIRARVVGLHMFDSFSELYATIPLLKCGYRPSSNSLSMGQVLHKPYTLPKSITHSISTPG